MSRNEPASRAEQQPNHTATVERYESDSRSEGSTNIYPIAIVYKYARVFLTKSDC